MGSGIRRSDWNFHKNLVNPAIIRVNLILPWNYSHCTTSSLLIVWVYLHSHLRGGLRKNTLSWSRAGNGRSRSSKVLHFVSNRKHLCNFLLVIHSNLGPILPRFRDMACFLLKTATPPLYHPNFGGSPWTRSPTLGLRERKPSLIIRINGTIPTYVFTSHQRHRRTDGRTDRQTIYDSNTALCITCIVQ